MNFVTPAFLAFLAVVFVVYWQLGRKAQNVFLILATYFFYAQWDWRFLGLIFFSTCLDYYTGSRVYRATTVRSKKGWLLLTLVLNLGLLGYFKYFNFFAQSFVDLGATLGFHVSWTTANIILPVGISFYTFETISYTIDIYRGVAKPAPTFLDFAAYVGFFPRLMAGPIVRARDFVWQLERARVFKVELLESGLPRFLLGFVKKAFVADTLAQQLVDPVFQNPGSYGTESLWLAGIGFAVQVYADFSGYSDMAVGASRILGFETPENFNFPYLSRNISEMWRRWHISMSSWFRDYVYIGLGGNRKGELRTILNLGITVFLSGLWHGAAWIYVVWGLMHGLFLATNQFWRRVKTRFGLQGVVPGFYSVIAGWLLTHFAWVLSLTLFRSTSLNNAGTHLAGMFGSDGAMVVHVSLLTWIALASVVVDHAVGWLLQRKEGLLQTVPVPVRAVVYASAVIALFYIRPEYPNPFVYFQF
jgi:alginate O-acetyltransferase complex protein AlgI